MPLDVEIIRHEEYVEAIISGEFDLQEAIDTMTIVFVLCKIKNVSDVLIDFRKVRGDIFDVQKIAYSIQIADQIKHHFASKSKDMRFAYVGKEPQISTYKPGLQISKIEGIQAMVTVDLNEALEWLTEKKTRTA